MTGTGEDGPGVRPAATKPSADPILDAKLHRPPTRADWVERDRLLELLDRAVERPVTLVAAPAGFGKTTLATQWLASDRAPRLAAWVSLDSRDNDPVRLWTHVAIALERAGCRADDNVASFMAAHGGEVIAEVLPRLLASIADMDEDLVILLDDFHFLRDVDCHTQVEFLVEHLPQHAHLVVLTRADPGLRIAWLRATGRLSEIRAADLAFTRRGDLLPAGRRAGSPVHRLGPRPGATHRGMGSGAVPRHVVHVRAARPGRVRPRGQRRQPLHR